MSNILVVSASNYNTSHNIAKHISTTLKAREGLGEILHFHADDIPRDFKITDNTKLCFLVSPMKMMALHGDMVSFVNKHLTPLAKDKRPPVAQLLVGLGPATIALHPEKEEAIKDFEDWKTRAHDLWMEKVGWEPEKFMPVAGDLAYTRYGWFYRWMIKMISGKQGMPTDTSKDTKYTDFDAVDTFVVDVVEEFIKS